MKTVLLEFAKGLIIGSGAILPGISGASLAVAFGVFEDCTKGVAHPFAEFKPFLQKHAALCFGIVFGFIIFAFIIGGFFRTHTTALLFVFSGFIASMLAGIFRKTEKKNVDINEILAFCISAGILVALSRLGTPAQNPALHPWEWIASGAIIAIGSLMPGISASFILIYFGMYGAILKALNEVAWKPAILLGAGSLAALILFSRLLRMLYGRYHGVMTFTAIGCTVGSLVLVFPAREAIHNPLLCVILFGSGFTASYFLDRLSREVGLTLSFIFARA